MFLTNYVLLGFLPRSPILAFAVALGVLDVILWRYRLLVEYELLLGLAGTAIGLVIGAFTSRKLLERIRRVTDPIGTSSS